ncbi:hypothetical protein OIU85_012810 [Salix viminalis]|uniref:Uncharacterized protein n=1 Tax=Salix viminalis TaxID=40686 RepID=A0A9Q0NQ35_SALVM|nr:hypothetical protein OIU85_012810 [Salix viminalis]
MRVEIRRRKLIIRGGLTENQNSGGQEAELVIRQNWLKSMDSGWCRKRKGKKSSEDRILRRLASREILGNFLRIGFDGERSNKEAVAEEGQNSSQLQVLRPPDKQGRNTLVKKIPW